MTIGTEPTIIRYAYSGPATFDFNFRITEEESLLVHHQSSATGTVTLLAITTDYTVNLVQGVDGGSIVIDPSLVLVDGFLELRRDEAIDQETDYVNNDPFDMDILERSLDKLTMIAQQQATSIEQGVLQANFRGVWTPLTDYRVNDLVQYPDAAGSQYICNIEHTSEPTWGADLASGFWSLYLDASVLVQAVKWISPWVSTTHFQHEMVKQNAFTMIANKETADQAEPQALGSATFLIDNETWTDILETATILQGVRIRPVTDTYLVTKARVWIADLSADAHYTLFIKDNVTGVVKSSASFSGDSFSTVGWFDFFIDSAFLVPGTDITLFLQTENSASSTSFTHQWVYNGIVDQDNNPGAGLCNVSTQQDTVRVNILDDVGTDRYADLASVLPGSSITLAEASDPNSSTNYTVISSTDNTSWYSYEVSQQGNGPGGAPGDSSLCDFTADIPVAQPAKAVKQTNYYLAASALTGVYAVGGAAHTETEDAYGVDVMVQLYSVSSDWDMVAYSGVANATALGVTTVPEAPSDGVKYVRQDKLWTPETAHSPAEPMGYNVLINGDFRINQREFDGNWAGLSDGDFGYDRWIRHSSGRIVQQTEGVNILPDNTYRSEEHTSELQSR